MSFKLLQEDGFYQLDFSDRVDKDLIMIAYSSLLKEKNFKQESHTLWDFRNAFIDLSINDIQQIADSVTASGKQRADSARCALVLTDPSDTAILQTYITATAHYPVEFRIFADYLSGTSWLLK